jgi:hypothetical protein
MVSLIPKVTAPKIAPTTTKNTSLFNEKSILVIAISFLVLIATIITVFI